MNWTIPILESLYNNYGSTSADLTSLFVRQLIVAHPGDVAAASQARDVLDGLEKEGLITWKVGKKLDSGGFLWNETYTKNLGKDLQGFLVTFETCRIEGQLTVKGLFLMEERLAAIKAQKDAAALSASTISFNSSAMELNNQMRLHNRIITTATLAIVIATIAQAIIAYLSYNKEGIAPTIKFQPNIRIEAPSVKQDSIPSRN